MTNHPQPLDITLADTFLLRLPTAESPHLYLTGELTLTSGPLLLCRWTEHDVHAAIRDLRTRTSVRLGPHGHLDLLFHGDMQLQLLAYNDHGPQRHLVAHTDEATFFDAVDRLAKAAGPCPDPS